MRTISVVLQPSRRRLHNWPRRVVVQLGRFLCRHGWHNLEAYERPDEYRGVRCTECGYSALDIGAWGDD